MKSDLHIAIIEEQYEAISDLISKGHNVNEKESDSYAGDSPLHVAVKRRNLIISKLLIDAGCKLNEKNERDLTPLQLAINHVDMAKLLVDAGADVNCKNSKELILLHTAVKFMNFEISKLLVDAGANVDAKDKDGKTALYFAVLMNNIDIAKLLVNAGADISLQYSIDEHDTPLKMAIKSSNINILEFFINSGVNSNNESMFEDNLLNIAVKCGNFDVVKFLVHAGFNVNVADKDGKAPLYFAAITNNIKITELLVNAGAKCFIEENYNPLEVAIPSSNMNILKLFVDSDMDFNYRSDYENSALTVAVKYGNFNVVKLLVDAGANVNATGFEAVGGIDQPCTPIKSAIKKNKLDIFKLIVDHSDFDINAKDSLKYTPLHYAAEYGNSSIVKTLLDAGADVNAKNCFDESPLHNAVESENVNILKLLVAAGADLHAVDQDGLDTPLHNSMRLKNINIVKFLLEVGSSVNAINSNGSTPLHIAMQEKNVNVLKILVQNGANVNTLNYFGASALSKLVEWEEDLKIEDIDNIEKNLRLILEYTDVNLVDDKGKNVLSKTLETIRSSTEINFFGKISKIILEHISKIKVLNFQLDLSLLNTITRFNDYNEYFTKCIKELEAAKITKLHNSWVTFFNLLIDDKNKFVKYAGNEDLIKDCEKRVKNFSIYGRIMKRNVNKGIIGRELFDNAANNLTYSMPIFNPTHLVIRDILDVLSKNDWNNLCEKKRFRQ